MHNSRIKGDVCTEEKKERLKAQKLNKEKEKKEELQKIEEELQMLETKEESPYYCDECEMDPHHIIQDSLF